MRKYVKKSAVAGAAVAVVVGGSMLTAAPAHAGGPGSVQVTSSTRSGCEAERSVAISAAKASGASVSGAYKCFNNDGTWFGGFVRNY